MGRLVGGVVTMQGFEGAVYPLFCLWLLVKLRLVFKVRRRILVSQSAGFAAP